MTQGTGPAADLARLRTQQVLSFLNGGPPVSAAPFGPAAPGVSVRAAIASTLPSRNRQVQAALEGTPIAHAAPVQATPALTGPPATVHTTAPPLVAAPTYSVHVAAPAALATSVPSVQQTLLPPLAASTRGSYNVLPAPRDTSRAPLFRAIPGYLDLPAPALAEDGTSSNSSKTSEDSSRMDVAQDLLTLQRNPRINQAEVCVTGCLPDSFTDMGDLGSTNRLESQPDLKRNSRERVCLSSFFFHPHAKAQACPGGHSL